MARLSEGFETEPRSICTFDANQQYVVFAEIFIASWGREKNFTKRVFIVHGSSKIGRLDQCKMLLQSAGSKFQYSTQR
jgi:hypothetical protein